MIVINIIVHSAPIFKSFEKNSAAVNAAALLSSYLFDFIHQQRDSHKQQVITKHCRCAYLRERARNSHDKAQESAHYCAAELECNTYISCGFEPFSTEDKHCQRLEVAAADDRCGCAWHIVGLLVIVLVVSERQKSYRRSVNAEGRADVVFCEEAVNSSYYRYTRR